MLRFVTCATAPDVLRKRLLASPCLAERLYGLSIYLGATSAAMAFNAEMARTIEAEWLVFVHQDVFLPSGWDVQFISALRDAVETFPDLAVAGVYGVAGSGADARRAGHVLDRGHLLREAAMLPCRVDSMDELLFAVRADSGLNLDPSLGFDFYASDLVLTALQALMSSVVVDACCEHWSSTPRENIPSGLIARVVASGEVFEKKWAHRLPLTMPCFVIGRPGDVASALGVGGLRYGS
jgi:hypothetical protein